MASIFRRELKEARAPVSLQYDKKTLSNWTTTLASVLKSVHFKKVMLKLPFGKHAASLPSTAIISPTAVERSKSRFRSIVDGRALENDNVGAAVYVGFTNV